MISSNNKRLLKNSIALYVRTFVVMLISLYATRVVLRVLGVTDYGIYNVVAGFVTMFSFISGALSLAISRFVTYEIGKGDLQSVRRVFSASIVVQIILAVFVLLISEVVGVWFLNTKLNIPTDRIYAANWIFHCSVVSFCLNLLSIPYNALITAFEKMKVFAYFSILEATLKLLVCYAIVLSKFDKLILYGILLMITSLIMRILYGLYCKIKFKESGFTREFKNSDIISIGKFAGWTFLSNGAAILNTQGINILTNIFFNVSYNAARGMATQAESAIRQFVNSFTVSINPQIIKQYAVGDKENLFRLICRGSKFSFFLFMFFALPFFFEANYILKIWLGSIPDKATLFFKLAIICSMIDVLGSSCTTACHATGNMKLYVLSISSLSLLVFPLSFLAYEIGMPVESSYYIFIFIYILIAVVRLFVMQRLIGFPPRMFVSSVFNRIVLCLALAVICPYMIVSFCGESVFRLLLNFTFTSLCSALVFILLGCEKRERDSIKEIIQNKINIPKCTQSKKMLES